MMLDMQRKKERYEADLFTLLPAEPKALIYFHDVRTFFANPLMKKAGAAVWDRVLDGLIVNEALLSLYSEGEILYIKTDRKRMDELIAPLKSDFEAYTIKENGTDVHIITLTDNRFFCYFYHRGVWIGSLRKQLISRAVSSISVGGLLTKEPLFALALKGLGQKVTANIVINTDSIGFFKDPANPNEYIHPVKKWVGCDLSEADNKIWISGLIGESFIDEKDEDSVLSSDLVPTNSYLIYRPYRGDRFDVWFHETDAVETGGRVTLEPVELYGAEVDRATGDVYRDYRVSADSSATVNAFVASLKQDSLTNTQYQGLLSGFNETSGCGFEADMARLFACSERGNALFLPEWMWEKRELFSPFYISYYAYIEESKSLFSLVFSPKE